jgi:hypothetical protein
MTMPDPMLDPQPNTSGYPAQRCGEFVESQTTAYPCWLPLGHTGPHEAVEVPRSTRDRRRWELSQMPTAPPEAQEPQVPQNPPVQPAPAPQAQQQVAAPAPAVSPGQTQCLQAFGTAPVRACSLPPLHNGTHQYMLTFPDKATYEAHRASVTPSPPAVQVQGKVGYEIQEQPPQPAPVQQPAPHPMSAVPQFVSLDDTPAPSSPEPTKQRVGDQPLPLHHEGVPSIQDRLIRIIQGRAQVGVQRYGTTLQPFNGRDSLLDAFEESLDLTIYLLQVMDERDTIQAQARAVLGVIDVETEHPAVGQLLALILQSSA